MNIVKTSKSSSKSKSPSNLISTFNKMPTSLNNTTIGKISKSMTPFFLTFEIFNMNVNNCLVDSRGSSNVIPYAIFHKINMEPLKTKAHIVQFSHSRVNVIGELRDVPITLASNSKVH